MCIPPWRRISSLLLCSKYRFTGYGTYITATIRFQGRTMTLPAKLGRYEIRRELGSGAMAVVYEGWDPSIQRRLAIKTIRRDQLDADQADQVIARLEREAQAAGRLSHPNIVSIYEIGEDAGVAFIAME